MGTKTSNLVDSKSAFANIGYELNDSYTSRPVGSVRRKEHHRTLLGIQTPSDSTLGTIMKQITLPSLCLSMRAESARFTACSEYDGKTEL
jgi:hypothetical protein